MTIQVDLNCDMGESFGAYSIGADEAIMPLITSANIACGFHAGDPEVMVRTVRLAKAHGVSVGAHPGFRDLVGFGRRELSCTPNELYAETLYQVGALAAVCQSQGVRLHHVKPHGALYNMANANAVMARAIAAAVADFDRRLILFTLPNSELERAALAAGLPVAAEVFSDRAYNEDGSLVSRKLPGAVHNDPEVATAQVEQMVLAGTVTAITGKRVAVRAETICVHGDNAQAAPIIAKLRDRLLAAGVRLAAPVGRHMAEERRP